MQYKVPIFFDFFICCPTPTWFRWRKSGRRAESDSGGDGLLANPRSRPTPLSAFRPPTAESVGWLLLLFATEKQRKKKKFSHVLLGPKVPKASARRFPRDCAIRGAARGAQDLAYAPPRGGRAAARSLFFRVKRECGFVVPPLAAFFLYGNAPLHSFFPQGDSRLGSDGEKADGGLKATAAGTVCLQTRAVARRRFQSSGRRQRNRSGGFCCFSPPKSREKRKSFSGVFLQRTKGHRAASRHLYKKKQSTKNTTLPQGSYTFDLPRKQPPSSP